MHPIATLQAALVTALRTDTALLALLGPDGVFDAPPRDRPAPYVVIERHDMRQNDTDAVQGQEHRVLLHCWAGQPSRRVALDIAARVVAAGTGIAPAGLTVTHAGHLRTETAIDNATGLARAAVTLRFFSE